MLQDGDRIGVSDTVPVENFMRQIEPSATGVLIEIAEDIGQLQGSTERFSDGMAASLSSPKTWIERWPTAQATRAQ